MINFSGLGIGSTTHHTLYEYLVGNVEEEETVGGNARRGQGFGLGGCAWETVEEPAAFDAVGLF
jgi:hypothetical protein